MKQFVPQHCPVSDKMKTRCRNMGLDPNMVLPIGLHGDGVPHLAKMRDSLEVMSWNFLARSHRQRIWFVASPKSAIAGKNTCDALFEVFAWRMRSLLLGVLPSCRHDGTPWQDSDRARSKESGKPLTMEALLMEF
jgi:hypothetical protein